MSKKNSMLAGFLFTAALISAMACTANVPDSLPDDTSDGDDSGDDSGDDGNNSDDSGSDTNEPVDSTTADTENTASSDDSPGQTDADLSTDSLSDTETAGNSDTDSPGDTPTDTESDTPADSETATNISTDSGSDIAVDTDTVTAVALCDAYSSGTELGTLFSDVSEVSGGVVSQSQPDVIWVHEDTKTDYLYSTHPDGTMLGKWALNIAPDITDWEDIAVQTVSNGPDYLWLADIGDNAARTGGTPRNSIQVIRIEEPAIDFDAVPISGTIETATGYTFTYPDTAYDAEGLTIDPLTGDLYFFTKVEKGNAPVFISRAPIQSGELEQVASLSITSLTAADIAINGSELIVRNYDDAYYWEKPSSKSWEDTLNTTPVTVSLKSEKQGETIAFLQDASGFYTTSEGSRAPIYFYAKACK